MNPFEKPSPEGAARAPLILERLGEGRLCGRVPDPPADDSYTPELYAFNAWLYERHGYRLLVGDLDSAVREYHVRRPHHIVSLTPDLRGLLQRAHDGLRAQHAVTIRELTACGLSEQQVSDVRDLIDDLAVALHLPDVPGVSAGKPPRTLAPLVPLDTAAPAPDEQLFRLRPGPARSIVVTYCDAHAEFPETGLDDAALIRKAAVGAAEWILRQTFGDNPAKLVLAADLARRLRVSDGLPEISAGAVREWAALQP